ncbi:MAG TPA: GlsB/YeaQ/YmgE family stress response membrane protein [Thermoanaerobaculia bacterium]|nr:GlsB/YeaQ/YmgE family stress response membrane protein [Thermoanaerobaculia bacterium]
MSYLFIVVIGAVVGWIAGQQIKGSELGVGVDLAAGAAGACLAVLLSRLVGPAAVAGLMLSAIIAILGGVGGLYAMRKFMKSREVPVKVRPRTRRP